MMSEMEQAGPRRAARRVLEHLKRHAPCTTASLADALDVSAPAVRAQLDALVALGLVAGQQVPAKRRGRPALLWELTDQAMEVFPDRHGDLTVELLDAMRTALGDAGLDKVLAARDERQRQQLEEAMT
ncbi:MAG: MarR family transcriptional regulator, partial [Acidimicrobiia bacterium]|nr:MarR family transcriptional regulator [Acidimicrobiia bacterium]